jgi:ornithine carbamoyltransferase
VDPVVIRTRDHAAVTELAQHSEIPVINAMTDAGHPCEVISEAFTILERRGKLDGLRLTFVGEDTNI